MNVCENEAVIAFDTLYTQNHIQILQASVPSIQKSNLRHILAGLCRVV